MTQVDSGSSDFRLEQRTRSDVLVGGLKNTVYNRLTVYFLVVEVVFVSLAFLTDYLAGPYPGGESAPHVMAGIFAVFGILVAIVYVLYVFIGVVFTVNRALRTDL